MGTTKQHFFSPISLQVIHKFTKCILGQMVQLWPLVAKGNDYIVSSVMLLFFDCNAFIVISYARYHWDNVQQAVYGRTV